MYTERVTTEHICDRTWTRMLTGYPLNVVYMVTTLYSYRQKEKRTFGVILTTGRWYEVL